LETQVLNLEMMQFESGPTKIQARAACVVVLLDAEHVLVIGGYGGTNSNYNNLASTEVLGVAANYRRPRLL
jgi:hypothetical protein